MFTKSAKLELEMNFGNIATHLQTLRHLFQRKREYFIFLMLGWIYMDGFEILNMLSS